MNKQQLLAQVEGHENFHRIHLNPNLDTVGNTYMQGAVLWIKHPGNLIERTTTLIHVLDPDTPEEVAFWDSNTNPIPKLDRATPVEPTPPTQMYLDLVAWLDARVAAKTDIFSYSNIRLDEEFVTAEVDVVTRVNTSQYRQATVLHYLDGTEVKIRQIAA